MNKFRAVTFNTHYSTTGEQSQPVFEDMLAWGASVFYLQELRRNSQVRMLMNLGLMVFRDSNYNAVAWVPLSSDGLGWQSVYGEEVVMSDQPYSKTGGGVRIGTGARVILCDSEGQTLDAVSFHPPSGIQSPDAPARRYKSFIEQLEKQSEIAHASKCSAYLGGCDDNWDFRQERFQNEDYQHYIVGRGTDMREVNAPSPTHGHDERGRYIDSFWVKRGGILIPRGRTKKVWDNPSEPKDHNGFGVELEWVVRP